MYHVSDDAVHPTLSAIDPHRVPANICAARADSRWTSSPLMYCAICAICTIWPGTAQFYAQSYCDSWAAPYASLVTAQICLLQ